MATPPQASEKRAMGNQPGGRQGARHSREKKNVRRGRPSSTAGGAPSQRIATRGEVRIGKSCKNNQSTIVQKYLIGKVIPSGGGKKGESSP